MNTDLVLMKIVIGLILLSGVTSLVTAFWVRSWGEALYLLTLAGLHIAIAVKSIQTLRELNKLK